MADRPILFSAPMVRALLANRKTQTRRVIKPRKHASLFDGGWTDSYVLDPGNEEWRQREIPIKLGDRLWVREAWAATSGVDSKKPSDIDEDETNILYLADQAWKLPPDDMTRAGKGRPSMFMLRWASRLTLIVTDVRVERLQDISEADAIAEGANQYSSSTKLSRAFNPDWKGIYREGYAELWNAINGPGAWESNPWVVAYTFRVIRQNIDQIDREAA